MAVPDVMVGVTELLRGLTEPGAGVVINTPVYAPFSAAIEETGRRTVEVPLLGRSTAGGSRSTVSGRRSPAARRRCCSATRTTRPATSPAARS